MEAIPPPSYDAPRVYFGSSHALYIGASYDPAPHKHYATQFVVGLNAQVEVDVSSCREPIIADAVAIASETIHRVTSGGLVALLLIEPALIGADAWRRSPEREVQFYHSPGSRDSLLAGLRSPTNDRSELEMHQQILALFGVSLFESPVEDERVIRVLELIQVQGNVTLAASSEHVGLSSGRLRHLFREQVGIPFRNYLLWSRMKRAIHCYTDGGTLTEAAHEAEFADSAHFTKSFSKLFGISPSTVLQAGSVVHFQDV